ncbi:hypothetical protein J1614_001643 [Plenodomus biglobosus]|nr:hypothetical protein J1614_001643 [Plenodomus biglobosus]
MVLARQDELEVDTHPLLVEGNPAWAQSPPRRRLDAVSLLHYPYTRIFQRPLHALKPSFLTSSLSTPPPRPRPTAWLDGLRGYAAFVVFIYHFQHQYHKAYDLGYGGNGGIDDYWIIQLPVMRVFYHGVPCVQIFWVLSGVALSLRPLQLARSQDWKKFHNSLFSSVFRRMLRLYLPCIAVSFGILIAILSGCYDYADWRMKHKPFFNMPRRRPFVLPTMRAQIADWAVQTWKWSNPLSSHGYRYNSHFWTIPTEFFNSILLFATLAGYSKLKPRVRAGCTAALYTYCLLSGLWDISLFFGGMACAEYILELAEHEEQQHQLPSYKDKGIPATTSLAARITHRIPKWAWLLSFYISLHLLSFPPAKFADALGFTTLTKLTPLTLKPPKFWRTNGAVLLLFTLAGGKFFQPLFSNRVMVYLGKISFPLYLLHGPMNRMLGGGGAGLSGGFCGEGGGSAECEVWAVVGEAVDGIGGGGYVIEYNDP